MTREFSPVRSQAMRSALIEYVARDLPHEATKPAGRGAAGEPPTRSPQGRSPRPALRPQWAAGLIALVLVGGLTGVAVTAALNIQDPTNATTRPDASTVYIGSGAVIERDGVVRLCLDGVAQSVPPGCMGAVVVLEGWTWEDAPASQTALGVRFTEASVTVRGTVRLGVAAADVPTLVVSDVLNGYVSTPRVRPERPTPSGLSDAELLEIVNGDLGATIGLNSAGIVDGVIEARVAWDNGVLQQAADDKYGEGVVVVIPLLTRE